MSKEELKPIDVSKYTVTESGNVIKSEEKETTNKELKQEAVEYVCKRNPLVTKEWFIDAFKKYNKGEKVKYLKDCEIVEYEAYLAGAEPREKQIDILSQHVLELQADKGELTDRVKELEAQIEKMECCENCAFFKDKTYDICHRIKKLGTGKCAFYKMM